MQYIQQQREQLTFLREKIDNNRGNSEYEVSSQEYSQTSYLHYILRVC